MSTATKSTLLDQITRSTHPLVDDASLDPLMERIGQAKAVLLGEATHGTSEFYTWRARISKRLIEEKGFNFIAVEGDWPDCYRVNRFVRDGSPGSSAHGVLKAFDQWPTWMWANWEVVAFIEWLAKHNAGQAAKEHVGFYGLDVYSLWRSMDAVLHHLEQSHQEFVAEAKEAFGCFEPFQRDEQVYAWSTRLAQKDCEAELVRVLADLQSTGTGTEECEEDHFAAEQNALAAVDAERYYRAMIRADNESWNVRDRHMADTVDRLLQHCGPGSKGIVWAHNTHVGDARYTDMARSGMVNIGQLVREKYGEGEVVIVGFGAWQGDVIAGEYWGAPMEQMPLPVAQEGSWEDLFYRASQQNQLLVTRDLYGTIPTLGNRAVGVVYNPAHERYGNYVPTNLARRYDAFAFFPTTEAVRPLHLAPHDSDEAPETYPWGV